MDTSEINTSTLPMNKAKKRVFSFLTLVAKETNVSKGKARLDLARKMNERLRLMKKRKKTKAQKICKRLGNHRSSNAAGRGGHKKARVCGWRGDRWWRRLNTLSFRLFWQLTVFQSLWSKLWLLPLICLFYRMGPGTLTLSAAINTCKVFRWGLTGRNGYR